MAAGAELDETLALRQTQIQATQIADLMAAMEAVQREIRRMGAQFREIQHRLDTLAAVHVLAAEIAGIRDGMADDGMPGADA